MQLCFTACKNLFGNVWVSKWLWGMFGDDINDHKGLGNVWVVTSCISDKKINNRIPVCENPNPKDLPNISDACEIRAGLNATPAANASGEPDAPAKDRLH